ncbi:FAD-dependent monooxygenase [Pseudonocardia sp. McavD-2-B]|jgi:2-polyprenyl-6-methoxyphenol hydroxylase-like FAD-dependent oxidoreductase|uniref:FAD-dependent monooxygenase n=1 Tax=Pseudonocardia sp. McavD-2-B TaxID=2954499 RepID=UPI00209708F6|nr:FAD-dependent monooxygenase [Pseudonocardia sp. McavD-2-B]MCO7193144.1 FAD-dependent monooxygenase [Pseudonocardia sp. McavD-2-B]
MTGVVVVGAGPTALLLAGDLAADGVEVTVLERRREESPLTRAFAVHARTLEQLDARGLADDLVATGTKVDEFRLFGSVSVDLSELPSRFPFLLVTPQYQVERALLARAEAAGAAIRRGVRADTVRDDGDTVTVGWTADDGSSGSFDAGYVVGADGHHSTVRTELGLDFPGESVVRSLMLADVRMTDPPPDVLTVDGNKHGFCFVVPYGDGWYRVIARRSGSELADDAPVRLAEIAEVARRVFGTDFGMHDPRWISRFHSEERQVTAYRTGRVLLAGDAAHVHSPAGGQGMNTGLQDAANLGWKLAAVLGGRAGDTLLDTYDAERRPVGATVLRLSGGLIRAALLRSALARDARNRLARTVLALPPAGRRVRGLLTGIGFAYPRSSGDHPLVGTRMPDLTGPGGARLYEALRGGRFVLTGPGGRPLWNGPVLLETADGPYRLVRPDGYVGWAGDDPAGLGTALARWGAGPAPLSPEVRS